MPSRNGQAVRERNAGTLRIERPPISISIPAWVEGTLHLTLERRYGAASSRINLNIPITRGLRPHGVDGDESEDDAEDDDAEGGDAEDAVSDTGSNRASPMEVDVEDDDDVNPSPTREYSPDPLVDRGRTSAVDERLYLETATLEECYATNTDECPICAEGFKTSEAEAGDIAKAIVCGHIFHRECLTEWVNAHTKSTCPYCREVLFEAQVEDLFVQFDNEELPELSSGSEYVPDSSDDDDSD
ncbi:hypothetical protein DM02DRAFT_653702 [Periconia macrospinosa]|uniref:RING-type domain-containing protein n=1 Tax=Periconia macrospinosa TaxID=97972 RepID=A0A2V1DYE2_9PLEO|nr:hypothetical protein DM02DRAFT_653702 [Periconia macrospinosa]